MTILDKISDAAKNFGDKAGEAIEIQKLNAKASRENAAIEAVYAKIGFEVYTEKKGGAVFSEPVATLCAEIDAHVDAIAQIQKTKERIRLESEQAKAQARVKTQAQRDNQPETSSQTMCPACGALTIPGKMFCAECGAKVTQQPESSPAGQTCAQCGALTVPGKPFCAECGAKV